MSGRNPGLAQANIRAYTCTMQVLPISKVNDKLSEYVDTVALTHEQVTITKNGAPAAVLIGVDEWEALQETLFWLSRPHTLEDLETADREFAAGQTVGESEIRAEFGVPRPTRG